MLSRSRSQFFSKKGSMLKERLSKFGVNEDADARGPAVRAARDGGRSKISEGGGDGS